ncbi:MAG: phosphoribosylanthranilate isomerase [Puniceicoccales bacterium]
MRVKVCGMTRVEDAELALSLGADYLGVIRYEKSPRMATEKQARKLCNSLPVGKRVCVDVSPTPQELEDHGDLGFDFFQLHFDLDVAMSTVAAWSGIVGREALWLAPRIPPGEPFPENVLAFADTVVIDSYHAQDYGGTGKTGNWLGFAELMQRYPDTRFVLAGGLNPENIREAIRISGARMVDVNSGVEESPGIKDHAKLRAFFSALAR